MAARKQARQPSGGPSHRSAEDFEAEFDQLDQLAYGPAPMAPGAAEHLRLAPEPPRMAAPTQATRAHTSRPYAPPPGMPTAELERLLRKTRRAALYAAVMSTFAFFAAISAVLATLVTLAA